jgi:hypothetical protein
VQVYARPRILVQLNKGDRIMQEKKHNTMREARGNEDQNHSIINMKEDRVERGAGYIIVMGMQIIKYGDADYSLASQRKRGLIWLLKTRLVSDVWSKNAQVPWIPVDACSSSPACGLVVAQITTNYCILRRLRSITRLMGSMKDSQATGR